MYHVSGSCVEELLHTDVDKNESTTGRATYQGYGMIEGTLLGPFLAVARGRSRK